MRCEGAHRWHAAAQLRHSTNSGNKAQDGQKSAALDGEDTDEAKGCRLTGPPCCEVQLAKCATVLQILPSSYHMILLNCELNSFIATYKLFRSAGTLA